MTNIFDKLELKPCAHCGSPAVKLYRINESNKNLWHVECMDCGIRTNDFSEDYSNGDHMSIINGISKAVYCAVSTWNDRVKDDNK